jgi:hypothetical protein
MQSTFPYSSRIMWYGDYQILRSASNRFGEAQFSPDIVPVTDNIRRQRMCLTCGCGDANVRQHESDITYESTARLTPRGSA